MGSKRKAPLGRPLSVKELTFIAHYVECGDGKKAATIAGYKPSYAAFASHRLLRRQIVANEIDKRIKLKVRTLAPKAVHTVEEVMDDKTHKDRLRAARTVLERSDPVLGDARSGTNVNVIVNQQLTGDELGLKIMRHLHAIGADRETMIKMLGPNTDLRRLEQVLAGEPMADVAEREPVVIEAEAVPATAVIDEPELNLDEDEPDSDG
jgi:hypothetical protein